MALKLSTRSLAQGSARRPWTVIGIWVLALVVAGALAFSLLQDALTTEMDFTNNPESKRGDELLEKRLRGPMKINEIVIVRSESLRIDDQAFGDFVTGLWGRLTALGSDVIESGGHYYLTRDESLVSADRHTTIIPLVMAGTLDVAGSHIDQVSQIVSEANGESGFRVFITGQASVGRDFEKLSEKDLRTGEVFGVPMALGILVLVFGAITAAIIPVVLAIFAIVVALGTTALIGLGFQFSFFAVNMITMMGLAVGIDYSLFVVSRYREERRRGLERTEAIAQAGATASRAVFFSGMTVILALLGMFIVPSTIYRSLAAGAILVVLFAVLAALTLLPAILSLLGDRINTLRVPFIQRAQARYNEERGGSFWDRVARGVMRYPVVSLVVAGGLLIAAAIPTLHIKTGFSGITDFPDYIESKQGFLLLEKEFPFNLISPAEIAIEGQISSPAVQAGIQRLEAILKSDEAFGPPHLVVNPDGDLALLSVPVMGDPFTEATDSIRKLRAQYVPEAFSGVPANVMVAGVAAENVDFFDMASSYTPIVFAFVLGLSFILLTVVFRSIIVPIKAIIMNLLSVGAAYGLLVLVTQKGVGADLLGFQQVSTVEAWLPIFLFAVLFGLSMDYHVFLLSRIREYYDQTQNNSEAVAFGLRSTGRIITGAALIMVAVFVAFASGDLPMLQQTGFGLAVAVFLDATVVRSILVPATMKLLGSRNWYLPRALQWLPDVRMETKEPASTTSDD